MTASRFDFLITRIDQNPSVATIYNHKICNFKQEIVKSAKKWQSMSRTKKRKKKESVETLSKGAQMLELADKNIKGAISDMFKKLKEIIF